MSQIIVIRKKNKPYLVGLITDVKSAEYQELVKQCDEEHEKEEKEKNDLREEVKNCKKKIHELEGKILLDEGKITLEEFNNGSY